MGLKIISKYCIYPSSKPLILFRAMWGWMSSTLSQHHMRVRRVLSFMSMGNLELPVCLVWTRGLTNALKKKFKTFFFIIQT